MIKNASFRELELYSRNDIIKSLGITEKTGREVIERLKNSNILKLIDSKAKKITTEKLQSSDIAIGNPEISDIEKRYLFDYVGLIELSIEGLNIIFNCFPKYIKRAEESLSVREMSLLVRVIERYNNSQAFSITISTGTDEKLEYNLLAIIVFLLRDYCEHGTYANTKDILEQNGTGEIEWESTIAQNIPLLKNGRPFYVNYLTAETTADESGYITRLHKFLLTKYSRYLRETNLDELFGIEPVELYEGDQNDFGDPQYIEQCILNELNAQYITHKQILLKAMYALIHQDGSTRDASGLSLFGTNSFNLVWEKVCADVFASQLKTSIKDLPLKLSDEYKHKTATLQSLIPYPRWKNYANGTEKNADGTLIPDYISVHTKGDVAYFVILDAKYYDICWFPRLSGHPGVDDVNKQYLYQLSYKDFIDKHNLIPINAFLCPGDIDTLSIAGEVVMPIFADGELKNIKVAMLSAKSMFQAYLSGERIDLLTRFPELFTTKV